jgi:hypothetical protein
MLSDAGAPDFADLLEFERRMRVIATPEPVCLARPPLDRRRQRLIHTPESRSRRRLHRGAESFPERCRLRFPESRNRAHRILNLPRFAGPSWSGTFELPKPRASRSLLSGASRLRLRFLPTSSRRKHSSNEAAPPSAEIFSFRSMRTAQPILQREFVAVLQKKLETSSPRISQGIALARFSRWSWPSGCCACAIITRSGNIRR